MQDTPEEILISRIIDRTATPAEWESFSRSAAVDRELWERLGTTLRADTLLKQETDAATESAHAVTLDAGSARPAAFAGWRRAAAAVVIAAVGVALWQGAGSQEDATPAGAPIGPAANGGVEARELDRTPIAWHPAADGPGYEIIYLRRIIERERAEAMELGTNEHGLPLLRRVDDRVEATWKF